MVSVLVAVYNAEKYLRKALDSLLSQTMTDWQAICVDDCSTDSSLEILREYEQNDGRFKVIHLDENRGQAHARNQALLHVKGNYISFLDSDDWLSPDALEKAVFVFEEYPLTDCVLFDCVHVSDDGKTNSLSIPDSYFPITGKQAFLDSLTWKIHGVYMIRTEIHLRYPYDESCRSYSDDNTTRLHYYASREVRCCTGKYYYLQHEDSSTHKVDASHINFLLSTASMKKSLQELLANESPEQREKILSIHETQTWLRLIDCYMFWYKYRRLRFGKEIHSFWQTIEMDRVDENIKNKFGYHHCSSWLLFRLQEEIYFTLRRILGKNNI